MTAAELNDLKKDGIVQQRQKDFFILRIGLVAGDAPAATLEACARVSQMYGRGEVHFTTRQSLEIPWIPGPQLLEARNALVASGVRLGVCGARVRGVVGCPGNQVCRFGQVDTKALASRLDTRYFGREVPHKFKFGVTGCVHNCAKATENDLGLMGMVEPAWEGKVCNDCGLCVGFCPVRAISRTEDGTYRVDPALCLGCPQCLTSCPRKAWFAGKRGLAVFVGGSMGKVPRLADRLPGLFTEAEAEVLADRALAYYQGHGQKKERFGRTLERMGGEAVLDGILGDLPRA